MNTTQRAIIDLAHTRDISGLSLRQIGNAIGVDHPQTVKYHLQKLEKSNLLPTKRQYNKINKTILGDSDLVMIPIVGSANCGPATMFAEEKVEGHLKVSSKLLRSRNYKDLFALKAVGTSMNKANIGGQEVNDGDFVLVDSSKKAQQSNEYVVVVDNGMANIKKIVFDRENQQIILLSESSYDFAPIYIHSEDMQEGLISGTVIQVIRNPRNL